MMEKILRGTQNDKSYDFVHFNEIMKECLLSMGLTEPGSSVVKEKEAGDVSRFLNRILGLSVEKQNLIFSYFSECLNATIETAKREGKYNEGVTDLTASSITMVGPPCPVFTEVKGIMPTQHVTLSVDRGIEWPAAMKRYENSAQGKHDGFYWSKREQRYQRFYLLAIQKENSTHLFNIIRPNTGQSPFEEEKTDLLHKYTKISPDEAEKGWKMQYDKTRDHCFHGPGCKTGPLCRVGCRISRVHLLCGGIVPILSTLEWAVSRHAEKAGLSREDRMLRVIRVELDDGQRLVGLRYPEQLIPVVTALLKEQQNLDPLLGMQSGLLGLTLPQRASTKVATEESVSNINSRTLAKAINPPVTIKNFFRPKLSIEENADAKGTDENIEQNNITSDGVTRSEPPTTSSSHASAVRVSPPMVSAPTKPAPSASKRGRPPLPVSKSNKRTASSTIGSRAKKSKQSSIFSSMGKGVGQGKNVMIKGGGQGKNVMVKGGGQGNTVSLKGEAGKEISADEGVANKEDTTMACPICNKAFEKGVGNAIINQHIDNCLIV
ncbi:predicted protein [Nematostella vectensis]|uniref:UBZ4-type domain-containing protein n=2 Tax=Nematostella vectensis TaxID=45351 RepID=A7RYE7_NEMVE|nr:predicted protein [Nematostella vectensis]|eukprot:XP_001635512.1 predicted protein [Nematostella vectensis]